MEKRINPNDIEAFDNIEVSKIKQSLSSLALEKWVILETPAPVYEILWRFYTEENILIKEIELLAEDEYKFGFIFPEYKLAKVWLEHVSWVQMTLARFQALYTWIILAIKDWGIKSTLSYEVCLKNLYNVLYRWWNITHRKVLFPWEISYLTIKVSDVIMKWNFYTIECNFLKKNDSFLYWTEKCILEDRFVNI